MFATLYLWENLFSVRISEKNFPSVLHSPFQVCPGTEAYACEHVLICLASYTFLCCTPKHQGPQLAPESPPYVLHMIDITAAIT